MFLENIDIRQPRKRDPVSDEAGEANLFEGPARTSYMRGQFMRFAVGRHGFQEMVTDKARLVPSIERVSQYLPVST